MSVTEKLAVRAPVDSEMIGIEVFPLVLKSFTASKVGVLAVAKMTG
jgi:hypothetical protein